MLGFSPISSTPFAALSGGLNFDGSVLETTVLSESVSAKAIYVNLISEFTAANDAINVLPSLFSAGIQELNAVNDTASSALNINAIVAELLLASDVSAVSSSTFNASISEELSALSQLLASIIFIASIQEGAAIADLFLARLLWEVINDNQTANWSNVNAAQGAEWTQINDNQTANWSNVNAAQGAEWTQINDNQVTVWNKIST